MPEDTFAGLDPSTGPSFFLFGLSVPLLPRARPHDEASELVEWKSSPPVFVDRFDARLLLDPLDTTEGIDFIPYSAASPSNDISASRCRATHDAGIGGGIVETKEQGIPSRETSKGEGEAAPYNEAFERELDRERYRDLVGDAEWPEEEGVMPDTEEGEGVGLEGNGVGWTMSRDRGGGERGGAAVPPWYGASTEIGVMMAVPVGLHGLFPLPPPKRTMDPENESRDGPLSPMHRAVMDRVAEFVARHGNESACWVQTRAALDPIFAFTLPTHRHYELFLGLVSRCRERILPEDPWRTDAHDLNVTGGEWNGNKDFGDDMPKRTHATDDHAEQAPGDGVSAEEEGLAGLLSIYNDDDGGSSDLKVPSSESPGRGQEDDVPRSPTMEYQESNAKCPAQSACYDPKGSGSSIEKESSEAVRDHRPLDLKEAQDDSTINHVKERLVASLKRGGYAFAKLLKQKMVTAEAFGLDFLQQSLEAAKAKASQSISEDEAVVVPAEIKCDREGSNVSADLENAIRIATEHARRLLERTRGTCLQGKRVDIAGKALLQDLSIEQIDDPFFKEIARILLEEGTEEVAKECMDDGSAPKQASIDGKQQSVEIVVDVKSDASGEGDAAVVREGRDVPRQPDIPPIAHLDKPEKKSGMELDGIESSFDLDTTVDDFRKAARLRKARRAVQAHRAADAAQKRSKRLLESMRDDEERRKKQAAISAHKRLLLGDDDE